jgi:hypothetical protein
VVLNVVQHVLHRVDMELAESIVIMKQTSNITLFYTLMIRPRACLSLSLATAIGNSKKKS